MRYFIFTVLLFGLLQPAQANWNKNTIDNPFEPMRVDMLSVADEFNDSMTLSCSINGSVKKSVPGISIHHGLGFSTNSVVKMDFQVDWKPTVSFDLQASSDDSNPAYRTAFYSAETSANAQALLTLIDQFIGGLKVRTVVTQADGTKRTNEFTLIGFTHSYRQQKNECEKWCCITTNS